MNSGFKVQAMKEEMTALEENVTWVIVDKSKDKDCITHIGIHLET